LSSSGSKLACIATDNSHSLFVWAWSKGQVLLERKSQPGAPPAVYGVVWSRFEPDR
jgi:microtubule-associated protein-like 6